MRFFFCCVAAAWLLGTLPAEASAGVAPAVFALQATAGLALLGVETHPLVWRLLRHLTK